MYDDYFSKATELTQAGVPFATAMVVRAEAPTSGKPGDKAIITPNGTMFGWIGGSCAQPTVVAEAIKALEAGESRLIRLSADPSTQTPRDGLLDLPMTCFSGGTLEIFIEPQHPRPRLMVVGNLPVAQALLHLGKAMNYHLIAVDPDGGLGMPAADVVIRDLAQMTAEIRSDTYIIVCTHGQYDEFALTKILVAKPTYVGLVASPKRGAAVREYLLSHHFSEDDLAVLHAPAGLDIQARRGDEIALSIMAEIVQARRNTEQLYVDLFKQKAQSIPLDMMGVGVSAAPTAIDPICQMEVVIATAHYVTQWAGENVYFCCAGCQTRFEKENAIAN